MGVAEFVQDGQAALAAADWGRARECFELALNQDAQHPEALDGLGRALHFHGEYGRAIELTERAFAAYLWAGRGVEAADRARWLAFLHGAVNANMSAAGGWMARAESALEGVEECAAHGWLQLDRAPFTEEIRQREQLAASALAIARRFGDIDLEYDALALLGEAFVAEGRVEEGMKLLEEARRLIDGHESHPLARRALAVIALGCGEVDLAEDLVHLCLEGEGSADPRCAPVIELQVRVRLARDDLAAATEARDRLVEVASASKDERARAHADLANGLVAVARGEPATAWLQAAVRRFSALALPLEAARAQLALARSLATGTPRAAVAEAQLALRTFERIGARPDADAAAALLRELGATGRSRVRGTGTLTAREAEVLALLAQGRTNAEIAERLVISRRTAEHHVANILSKLDLRTRAEAAAYALQGGSEDR